GFSQLLDRRLLSEHADEILSILIVGVDLSGENPNFLAHSKTLPGSSVGPIASLNSATILRLLVVRSFFARTLMASCSLAGMRTVTELVGSPYCGALDLLRGMVVLFVGSAFCLGDYLTQL